MLVNNDGITVSWIQVSVRLTMSMHELEPTSDMTANYPCILHSRKDRFSFIENCRRYTVRKLEASQTSTVAIMIIDIIEQREVA